LPPIRLRRHMKQARKPSLRQRHPYRHP
jgi:hypothetical protein